MSQISCPGCGARMSPDASRCELCGTNREEWEAAAAQKPLADGIEADRQTAGTEEAAASAAPTQYCSSCGTENPAHARFCWQCGEGLMAPGVRKAPPPPTNPAETRAEPVEHGGVDSAGKHAVMVVAGAAALVVVLFVLTQLTGRPDPLTPPGEAGSAAQTQTTQAAPLPPEAVERIETLENQIAQTDDGSERLMLREQLVDALVRVGAFARAGEVQEAVARELETADAWADAGSFHLAYVLRSEAPPEQAVYAERAYLAFERALEFRPGDLDIKTDLATAYRYHPEDPMKAVTLIQEVLQEDPDHPRARFNYGLMLAQIGRNDQALEQFEHVIEHTTADDFVHERAHEMIEQLGQAPRG